MIEESVYSLVPKPEQSKDKQPMYRSHHGHAGTTIPPTASTFGFHGTSKVLLNVAGAASDAEIVAPHPARREFATFGKAVSNAINPHEFLKKAAGTTKQASTSSPAKQRSHSSEAATRAPVPKRREKPIMGLKTDKNFVVANAVDAILTAPKRVAVSADRAVERSTFGALPEYLQEIKTQLKRTAEEQAKAAAEKEAASKAQELSDSELDGLRQQLQHRRAELNKQYLTLSVNLHTQSQLKRKEYLEKNLQALDAAITKLVRKKIVVVEDR